MCLVAICLAIVYLTTYYWYWEFIEVYFVIHPAQFSLQHTDKRVEIQDFQKCQLSDMYDRRHYSFVLLQPIFS